MRAKNIRNIKKILTIFFAILLFVISPTLCAHAAHTEKETGIIYRVTSSDEIIMALSSDSDNLTLTVSQDIVVSQRIPLADKKIIIKSADEKKYTLYSSGNDYIFELSNSELLLDSILLSSCYKKGYISGNGIISFCDSSIILSSEETIAKDTPVDLNDASNAFDLASLVISWSGFFLTFITVIAAALAFFGYKEVKDIRAFRLEMANAKVEVKQIEDETRTKLDDLKKVFQNEANSIMFGTYFYSLGTNQYSSANYRDAINSLNKSLEFVPNNAEAICLLGRAYSFVEESKKSFECYERALAFDPNSFAAYRGLAAWYRYSNLEEALKYAKKAVDLAPQNTELLNYYAQLLRDNNNITEALNYCIKSNTIQQHPDTDFFLSILYLANDSLGMACSHIKNAIGGYTNENFYGVFKPVWKELALWIQILICRKDEARFPHALSQLEAVKDKIDSKKTARVVAGHIEFVLNSLKQEQSYIDSSKKKVAFDNGNI